jgi:hypothetical protein
MSEPTIRPEVVALLQRLDMGRVLTTPPERWTLNDGERVLTPEELDLVGSATLQEFQASRDLTYAKLTVITSELEAEEELFALCEPYMVHPDVTVNEAIAQMPAAQRERAEYLLRECLPTYITKAPRNP